MVKGLLHARRMVADDRGVTPDYDVIILGGAKLPLADLVVLAGIFVAGSATAIAVYAKRDL